MSDTFRLDPAPEEWLSPPLIDKLRAEISSAVPLMSHANVLRIVLRYWIRRELGDTEDSSSGSTAWARSQWGHRLDGLFLQRKDWLDEASCRLLRVNQHGLALELYYRLLAEEATFEEVSQQFGVGPERFHGGLLMQQTLVKLPGKLGKLLAKLEPSELTKPFRMGKQFGIVRLESFVPAVYGEASEAKILELELQQWVDGMATHLETLVCSFP